MKKLLLFISMIFILNAGNIEQWEKNCENGNGIGCFNVGVSFAFGEYGVRQDYFQAKEYYEKGCELNDGNSCKNLGVLYYKGEGVKQNKSKAKYYFGKACDLKLQVGCKYYSVLNSQGY